MKRLALTICCLTAIAGFAITSTAIAGNTADTQPAAPAETTLHTALYTVKALDKDLAIELVKGLEDVEGVVAARPDMKANSLAVTFKTTETKAELITKALTAVNGDVVLASVTPADPAHAKKDCGKCPHKKGCAKKKSQGSTQK